MNTQNPKVSVVIPVYNGERYLSFCLESVTHQNYSDYEIIIVDNNSTDKTKDIINLFQKDDSRIRYIFEKERSRGAARNAGITEAKGEIIAMTDSDCVAPRDWLENIIKPIINEGEDIVMGFEEDIIKNFWTKIIQEQQQNHFELYRYGDYIRFLDTKNFAIRSEIIKKYLFDRNIKNSEDFEFVLRVRDTYKIRYMPEIKVGHHHSPNLISWAFNTFRKGYWTGKIYEKHKKNKKLVDNDVMFKSKKIKDLIKFFYNILGYAIKNPIKKSVFAFITGVAWRAGIFLGSKNL